MCLEPLLPFVDVCDVPILASSFKLFDAIELSALEGL